MTDLWGALDEPEPLETVSLPVAVRTPDVVVKQDLINHDNIRHQTEQLRISLDCSAQIAVAAYKVADYVPNLRDSKYREFWEVQIIPTLVKSLDHDVKARSIVMESFGSVRELAINIKQGAELVKLSKGSPAAVAAAQRTISTGLADLSKSIQNAESLKSSVIDEFAEKTEALLKIMGPETAKYSQKKSEIGNLLRKEYEKERELHEEIVHKKGEVQRYSNLIHVTENRLHGSKAALSETKRRTQDIMSLNDQIEKNIQSISATMQKTETKTETQRSWLLPWRKTTSTHTSSKMIDNPNRDSEKNYYESLILARMARVRENQNEEIAKEKVKNDLEQSLCEYKAKYQTVLQELQDLEKTLPDKMAAINREITSLNERLIDIDKEVTDATNLYGHHGDTLVQCLTEVRTLAKAINNGATAYTPLVGVLKAVKASVDAQIELLMSKDEKDIFLGGNQLLRQVDCLAHYHTCAVLCFETSQEYKTIAATTQMKAIQISPESPN